MECRHCKSEWNVNPSISSTMANCPFCGKSLLPEKETLSTVEDVLLEINRLFGINALTDNSKLIAYFYDLAPQLVKHRRILKYFVECNGPKKIASVMCASKDEQSNCVRKIVQEMKDEMFIEESAAQTICDAFLFAATSQQAAAVTATQLNATSQKDFTSSNNKQPNCISADEQYRQGEAYYYGTDTVPRDYKKAFMWYQKAALQGNPLAQCQLGLMYREGQGTEKDEKAAFGWFMKAADDRQACPRGKFYVARSYHHGNGVPVDYEKAVKWYLTAAHQNDAYAQLNLGNCFEYGTGVGKDLQMAVYWYERAANQEEPLAQCNLGSMYLQGVGVTKNASTAITFFRKSAAHREPHGLYMLGRCYLYGEGVEKDLSQAFTLINQAADLGDSWAQFRLAHGYEKGIWGKPDLHEAFTWYERAAKAGHVNSQMQIARYYLAGSTVKKNPATAVQWYQEAANGGSVPAMVILSECYERGNILPKDELQAIHWFEKAVQKDYQLSIYTFLLILAEKKNLTEANCNMLARFIGDIDKLMEYPSIAPILMRYGYRIAYELVSQSSTHSVGVRIMELLANNGDDKARIFLSTST